jgi:hypothetical protein
VSKQPEALRLADALKGQVQVNPRVGENDPDCGYVHELDKLIDEAADELRRQHAALAEPEQKSAFQVDAERYRWLRGEVQGPHTPLAQVVWKRNNIRESGDWTNLSDGQALDEAIDAALAAALAEPDAAAIRARGSK